MKKKILIGKDAILKLQNGVEKGYEVIKTTLGPRGNYVLYENNGRTNIVNDGITIIDEITLEDSIENLGISFLKEVAKKTNDEAGDGTTSAMILISLMLRKGISMMNRGANPIFLRKGMLIAQKDILHILDKIKKPIKDKNDIKNIASVSSSDEEIGTLISNAIEKVGKDGIVTIQEGRTSETLFELSEGLRLNRGILSPFFFNNEKKQEFFAHDVLVLVTDLAISSIEDIIKVLEIASTNNRPMLIICDDIKNIALTTLLINARKFNIAAIKTPSFGEQRDNLLKDICSLVNAKMISKDKVNNLKELNIKFFGKCESIKVNTKETILLNKTQGNNELNERIEQIRFSLQNHELSKDEIRSLQERLAFLTNGIGIIKVGASSETEMKAKKLKIEDALNATKSALDEGIVAGGGLSLVNIYKELEMPQNLGEEEELGYRIVKESLVGIMKQISENSGVNGDVTLNTILNEKDQNIGFNSKQLKFCNLIESGVLDSVKVIKNALINSISISSMILTAGSIIAKDDEKGKNDNMNEMF